jgi:hypothetical protein
MPRQSPLLTLSPLLAALLVAGITHPAAAAEVEPPGRVHRKWRLHLDTDALGWTRTRAFPYNDEDAFRSDNVGLGFARPLAGDRTLSGSMFGLGLGYGVSQHLIVGARLGLSFDHTSDPNDQPDIVESSTNYFGTVFTPYLEVLPLSEGRILPFLLVRTGFHAAAVTDRARADGYSYLDRTSLIAPTIGLGGGAHFLITDYFSLDLSLMFDYRWIFSKSREEDPSGVALVGSWERELQSFTLGAVLGFSVWFGGR